MVGVVEGGQKKCAYQSTPLRCFGCANSRKKIQSRAKRSVSCGGRGRPVPCRKRVTQMHGMQALVGYCC